MHKRPLPTHIHSFASRGVRPVPGGTLIDIRLARTARSNEVRTLVNKYRLAQNEDDEMEDIDDEDGN